MPFDVDFLIRGDLEPLQRAHVERAAANAFRGAGNRYDLIFQMDLSSARQQEIERDLTEAPRNPDAQSGD
jgi:hypothetical protein